jgi:hypothetical protein
VKTGFLERATRGDVPGHGGGYDAGHGRVGQRAFDYETDRFWPYTPPGRVGFSDHDIDVDHRHGNVAEAGVVEFLAGRVLSDDEADIQAVSFDERAVQTFRGLR